MAILVLFGAALENAVSARLHFRRLRRLNGGVPAPREMPLNQRLSKINFEIGGGQVVAQDLEARPEQVCSMRVVAIHFVVLPPGFTDSEALRGDRKTRRPSVSREVL